MGQLGWVSGISAAEDEESETPRQRGVCNIAGYLYIRRPCRVIFVWSSYYLLQEPESTWIGNWSVLAVLGKAALRFMPIHMVLFSPLRDQYRRGHAERVSHCPSLALQQWRAGGRLHLRWYAKKQPSVPGRLLITIRVSRCSHAG